MSLKDKKPPLGSCPQYPCESKTGFDWRTRLITFFGCLIKVQHGHNFRLVFALPDGGEGIVRTLRSSHPLCEALDGKEKKTSSVWATLVSRTLGL